MYPFFGSIRLLAEQLQMNQWFDLINSCCAGIQTLIWENPNEFGNPIPGQRDISY